MIKIERICRGLYYDKISHRCIKFIDGKWDILHEFLDIVYFSADTLKECKRWQEDENEILSWNN